MKNDKLPQKEMDKLLEQLKQENRVPSLFLHCCCAPCSSYVLEYLAPFFEITAFYDNPNIFPVEEYEKRAAEMKYLVEYRDWGNPVHLLVEPYEPERYYQAVAGYEKEPEGGMRCQKCFDLRLRDTAEEAKNREMDYFATSLTISPLKDARLLNAIGQRIGEELGVTYLPSDFKKNNGYQRSTVLSREMGLYRQNFCGCVYSKAEAEERRRRSDYE